MALTRREMLQVTAGAGASVLLSGTSALGQGHRFGQNADLIMREIPSSGVQVPVIGIGTRNFRIGERWDPDTTNFRATLAKFHEMGGRLLDTAPSYGDSESIVGDIVAELGVRDDLFMATKVDREGRDAGAARMEASFEKLHTDHFELMQVHNLRDWRTHLPVLREMKQAGTIGHYGITTSSARQYETVESIMREQELDFVQINYSIDRRQAADVILPLAQDRGVGVLVNLPFGRGRLFARVGDRELPDWTAEFDCTSWGQFFLKYVASHPAITAVIPGTTKPHHAQDNMGAARGRLPTPALRERMEVFIDGLPEG
jgi:aryl-alcohol dehydrogenase-like predicted oxidoreductase